MTKLNELAEDALVHDARRSYLTAGRLTLVPCSAGSHPGRMVDHVIVMGGTSGIGRATALRVAAAGARVSVVGRSLERGAEIEQAIRAVGGQARFIRADLREPGAAERAVEQAIDGFGPFGAAVNAAAGVVLQGPLRLHELDEDAFEREVVAELRICVASMRAELAAIVRHGPKAASIVNVSSVNGLGASPRAPFYSAVKAAQLALTKSAALDYAADGVRVNAIVLGAFDTPMLSQVYEVMSAGDPGVRDGMRSRFMGLVPLGRVGDADEAATVIGWLCSTESSYVTGASWIVDGGMTAFAR